MSYTIKKITNPASVYPEPAYKVLIDGEEVGVVFRINVWRYKWKFEAANFPFNCHARTIADAIGEYMKEVRKEGE